MFTWRSQCSRIRLWLLTTQQLCAILCFYEVMPYVTQGLAALLWLPCVCSAVSHHFDELQPASCRWSLCVVCCCLCASCTKSGSPEGRHHFKKVHSIMPYFNFVFKMALLMNVFCEQTFHSFLRGNFWSHE